MTKKEAEKVIILMTSADGDCYHCAGNLISSFVKDFPMFKEIACQLYKNKFKKELYDDD